MMLYQDHYVPVSGRLPTPSTSEPNRVQLAHYMPVESRGTQVMLVPGAIVNLSEGFIEGIGQDGRRYKVPSRFRPSDGLSLEQPFELASVIDPEQQYVVSKIQGWLAGYPFPNYSAGRIAQRIPVGKRKFKHRMFGSDHAMRLIDTSADDESHPQMISSTPTLYEDKVGSHRLACWVGRVAEKEADWPVEPTQLKLVARCLRGWAEYLLIGAGGKLLTSSNWASGHYITLSAGLQWGGPSGIGATSDPTGDMFELMNLCPAEGGVKPMWWCNPRTAQVFLDHPKVKAYQQAHAGNNAGMPGNNPGPQEVETVTIRNLGTLNVVRSQYQTDVSSPLQWILPDGYMILTYPREGVPTTGEDVSTCYTYGWNFPSQGGSSEFGVRQFVDETRGAGGTLTIMEWAYLQKIVGSIMGGVIKDVIQ